MTKLTKKEYWDSIYNSKAFAQKRYSLKDNLKSIITRVLDNKFMRPYADYLLWDVIYKKYMPKTKGAKILEVGSAPGNNLIRLKQRFAFIPYGVDYSDKGVEINRKLFVAHNINPDHVIHADFLSDTFQKKYRKQFDIIISMGFIEHFDDVEDIIEKHVDLLNEGGCLIVSIPNFKGINYALQLLFNKELLSGHNLDIMQKRRFAELFERKRVSTLFCDYYGTFNFGLFIAKRNSPLWFMLTFTKIFQLLLNFIFRLLLRNRGVENRFFSPYLLFIGIKKN